MIVAEPLAPLGERTRNCAAKSLAAFEFDAMSLDELRAYIEANTGKAPMGSLNRKNLTRMAENSRPEKAA